MARKSSADSQSHHGLNDVVGVVLLGLAMLLLVAMLSYNPHDIRSNYVSTEPQPTQNWIGPLGAYIAYAVFFVTGIAGYFLPFLLLFLGLGCFFERFAYLRRRWPWTILMMLSLMGLLDLVGGWIIISNIRAGLNVFAGGVVGKWFYDYGFKLVGMTGAAIIYAMLYFISLLYLTNFQLGPWLRRVFGAKGEFIELSPEEDALERRAKDLRKQEQQLQKELERGGVAVGADLQPVPKPEVRDLSVPQKKGPRFSRTVEPESAKESEAPREIASADQGDSEVITPPKKGIATAKEILGTKGDPAPEEAAQATEAATEPAAEKPPAPVVTDSTVGQEAEADDGGLGADDWELQAAVVGFSAARGSEHQAHGVERRIAGQCQLDEADAGAIQYPGRGRQHHQGADHHPLRVASRAGREARQDQQF
jgi:hypothetical protein